MWEWLVSWLVGGRLARIEMTQYTIIAHLHYLELAIAVLSDEQGKAMTPAEIAKVRREMDEIAAGLERVTKR